MLSLHDKRVIALNEKPENPRGQFVLYWLQMTHRTKTNFALNHAIETANRLGKPLLVYHGLNENYPHANARIHTFILEGVNELYSSFQKMNINYGFYLVHGKVKPILSDLIKKSCAVVSDDYPTFMAPAFNQKMAQFSPVSYVVVDSHTTVPLRYFDKEEWAAYTIRPKIHRVLHEALQPIRTPRLDNQSSVSFPNYFLEKNFSVSEKIRPLKINHDIPLAPIHGGEKNAWKTLDTFVEKKLSSYEKDRNNPSKDATSGLSPYLHFGMISPIDVALHVKKKQSIFSDGFLEELIVRRDLAYNFCHFNTKHTTFAGLNEWAQKTLNEHRRDTREYAYSLKQFEEAKTHDALWNAAQREMVQTGRMHGYMRMYWAKKILEWTRDPEEAFRIAVFLNDKYELDGRDPNGYAGIAWSLGGKHDRAWFSRKIFGKIRYMSGTSLQKKVDVAPYLRKWSALEL